jgi:hypothetical protein
MNKEGARVEKLPSILEASYEASICDSLNASQVNRGDELNILVVSARG